MRAVKKTKHQFCLFTKQSKSIIKLLLIIFTFSNVFNTTAQITIADNVKKNNYLQLSTRVGYDMPTFKNNTPYIDYKGGMEFGASLDYYWSWIGLGLDFDYINNKPESIYPTNFPGTTPSQYTLTEDKIKRTFLGIGPSFKYQSPTNNKFTAEFNARVGISNIKGGRTELKHTPTTTTINFHAGYDAKSVLSSKAQIRLNYFFNDNFGANIGAYYLQHHGVTELSETINGQKTSAMYFPWEMRLDPNGSGNLVPTITDDAKYRSEPCDCNISSIGVFAGINYKFSKKVKEPEVCVVCGCGVTVTARDKFTKEILPDTDVVLVDMKGDIIQSGKTNSYGTVVFTSVDPNDYIIKGKLYNVNLEETTLTKAEFKDCLKTNENVQKEIVYSDMNFILKGNAVECNTTTPIPGVSVVLKNLTQAEQKTTRTGSNGEFIFNVKQASTYAIYGKKDNYFSQTETISTEQYDRSTTLFVKLEICMEKADCNTAIALNNIHYDLDKYFIRESAKPELNRLVQFMQDNPSIHVQVGSHTDSRGSNSYNKTLSQNRANAAVDYVVSQGISRSKISGVGYGETVLLNRCADGVECSKEEHQINRRTEMRVVCP